MTEQAQSGRSLSLLDVALAFAVCSLLVSFTVPGWFNDKVRQRVDVSMTLADEARLALETTCSSDPYAVVKDNLDADYFYIPSDSTQDHARKILLGADCAERKMAVVLWTSQTGAAVDPVIEWAGEGEGAETRWTCRLVAGDARHVPGECREVPANSRG